MSQAIEIYQTVESMTPLLPERKRGDLAEVTVEIFKQSGRLREALPSRCVRREVAKLVEEMNSYYSNLIEGHKTLPRDIEKALRNDYSQEDRNRKNQELSVAHVKADHTMRTHLRENPEVNVFGVEFLTWLHRQFYSHLPKSHWVSTSKSGKSYPLKPGVIRDYNVDVHQHLAPDHAMLSKFFKRFEERYSSPDIVATEGLVAVAAAHHRLAWIHPFGDGNGRVARLQSQAALSQVGVDGDGMWTLSRGFARAKEQYYEKLQQADSGRRDDFDGRGNLSDLALAEFCLFFLKQALDQITFMVDLLRPFDLVERIERYLRFSRVDLEPIHRERLEKLLRVLCLEGEVARGRVPEILGVGETVARETIRRASSEGLITSASEKGNLRIAFPAKVVEYYFPGLFVDLPVSE